MNFLDVPEPIADQVLHYNPQCSSDVNWCNDNLSTLTDADIEAIFFDYIHPDVFDNAMLGTPTTTNDAFLPQTQAEETQSDEPNGLSGMSFRGSWSC